MRKDARIRDRRAAGVCIRCGRQPSKAGAWRCRSCQDLVNLKQRENAYRANRIFRTCNECGGLSPRGRWRCPNCLKAAVAASLARRKERRGDKAA